MQLLDDILCLTVCCECASALFVYRIKGQEEEWVLYNTLRNIRKKHKEYIWNDSIYGIV